MTTPQVPPPDETPPEAVMAPPNHPGFANTHDEHCRDCMPHDVPVGTTVICQHRNHYYPHPDESKPGLVRHVIITAGGPQPLRPNLEG
jgi:hypothetical protein